MEKNKDNVIEFCKKDELSESEINSLFLGLVRLIKKSAEKSIERSLKKECSFATKMANMLQIKLKESEKEKEILKTINHNLVEENQKLKLNLKKQSEIIV